MPKDRVDSLFLPDLNGYSAMPDMLRGLSGCLQQVGLVFDNPLQYTLGTILLSFGTLYCDPFTTLASHILKQDCWRLVFSKLAGRGLLILLLLHVSLPVSSVYLEFVTVSCMSSLL